MITVKAIYISDSHNYYGHYGKPAGRTPWKSLKQAICVAGKGIVGDRFYDYKENYKGQITLFDYAVFQELSKTLEVTDKEPGVLRRNIITEGIDLNTLIGKKFNLQGVELEGSEECSPCFWMNQAFAEGAEAFLKGRGGLRCRILSSGTISVDSQ